MWWNSRNSNDPTAFPTVMWYSWRVSIPMDAKVKDWLTLRATRRNSLPKKLYPTSTLSNPQLKYMISYTCIHIYKHQTFLTLPQCLIKFIVYLLKSWFRHHGVRNKTCLLSHFATGKYLVFYHVSPWATRLMLVQILLPRICFTIVNLLIWPLKSLPGPKITESSFTSGVTTCPVLSLR